MMIELETIDDEYNDNHIDVYMDSKLIGTLKSLRFWYEIGEGKGYFETFDEGLSAFLSVMVEK